MGDVVWVDVLPSMTGFAANISKESTKAAMNAGKSAGRAWSQAVGAEATGGAALVADLEKASRDSEKTVRSLAGKISEARASERAATANVVLAEQKLIDARAKYGEESAQARAADLKLEAARDKAQGATDKFTAAEDALKAAQREHREVVKQLEDATGKLNTEVDKSPGIFARMRDSMHESSGGAGSLTGSLGDVTAGLAGALGAAELFKEGLSTAWDQSAGVSKLEASLGLTESQSARAGDVAGALFSRSYGESMGEVTAAVGSVMSSIDGMRSASSQDLEQVTGVAMNFASAFDVGVSEAARNAGILVKTGLAPDAIGAFDLMTGALQQVPEALRGEVMDATQEYSTYFQALGIDGADAMGMLVSATENGQYGIDKMGDSLKEFTIRSTDMSAASKVAFDALGMDQQTMANRLLAGGETAKQAMGEIVTGLQGIDDPALQAQASLALFGTPLEDLGTDQIPAFLEMLDPATASLDTFTGSAEAMNEKMNEAVSPVDEFTRGLQGAASEGLAPLLEPATAVIDWLSSVPGGFTAVTGALATLAIGVGAYTVAQWAMNSAMLASPITWIILAIAALVAGIVLLVSNWDTVREAGAAAWQWIKDAWSSAGKWFSDLGSSIGRVFSDAWNSIKNAFSAVGDFFGGIGDSIKGAFKTAFNTVGGFWNDTVGKLSWSVPSWVPGIGGKTLSVPKIPMLADGGQVIAPGLALVGERGPEILALDAGAKVVPLNDRPDAGAGNPWRAGINIEHAQLGGSLTEFQALVEWEARTP